MPRRASFWREAVMHAVYTYQHALVEDARVKVQGLGPWLNAGEQRRGYAMEVRRETAMHFLAHHLVGEVAALNGDADVLVQKCAAAGPHLGLMDDELVGRPHGEGSGQGGRRQRGSG